MKKEHNKSTLQVHYFTLNKIHKCTIKFSISSLIKKQEIGCVKKHQLSSKKSFPSVRLLKKGNWLCKENRRTNVSLEVQQVTPRKCTCQKIWGFLYFIECNFFEFSMFALLNMYEVLNSSAKLVKQYNWYYKIQCNKQLVL